MRSKKTARMLLIASVVLFLVSLTQNAFCVRHDAAPSGFKCDIYGIAVLVIGWLGILTVHETGPLAVLPWFANPCLLAAWIAVLTSRRAAAMIFSALGALLGLSFLFARTEMISEAGGAGDPIASYGAGYWLWLASLAVAFASAWSTIAAASLAPHDGSRG